MSKLFDNRKYFANIQNMTNNLLSDKESIIFKALARLGPLPISQIAKETELSRTALYHTVGLLTEKGLVTEIKKNSTTLFQPLSKEEFTVWSKNQLKDIGETMESLATSFTEKTVPVLHSGVRYFEGKEGVKKMYNETWRENKEKHILAITDYKKAYETLDNFFDEEYFPLRVKAGVKVKSLLSMDAYGKRDVERQKELLREMRFSDVFKNLGIELNIFDDKLAIIAFDEKKPMGMILQNKIISQAFKQIFSFLWKESTR
jgi:sugar-specific transcriptional regulator TrmB